VLAQLSYCSEPKIPPGISSPVRPLQIRPHVNAAAALREVRVTALRPWRFFSGQKLGLAATRGADFRDLIVPAYNLNRSGRGVAVPIHPKRS
jgi:hypothetical protein